MIYTRKILLTGTELTTEPLWKAVTTAHVEYVEYDNKEIIIRIIKRPYHNKSGEIVGVMGVYWEITEELKNKIALSDNRSQLRMALESAEIGVWTWDFKQKKYSGTSRLTEFSVFPGPLKGTEIFSSVLFTLMNGKSSAKSS